MGNEMNGSLSICRLICSSIAMLLSNQYHALTADVHDAFRNWLPKYLRTVRAIEYFPTPDEAC
jgi:hypothetical protein